MTGFLFAAAFFSNSQTITMPLKILLSFVLLFLVFSFVKPDFDVARAKYQFTDRVFFSGNFIGYLYWFCYTHVFFHLTMVGSLISVIIGLSSSQLFNPMIGDHGNSFEQYYSILATLVFLSFNGHHYLLMGIEQSYSLIPIGNISIQTGTLDRLFINFKKCLKLQLKCQLQCLWQGLLQILLWQF